jgi:hypothetical protein
VWPLPERELKTHPCRARRAGAEETRILVIIAEHIVRLAQEAEVSSKGSFNRTAISVHGRSLRQPEQRRADDTAELQIRLERLVVASFT